MISSKEAVDILKLHPKTWGVESIPLEHAFGRIIMQSVKTDRSMPPFDRVTMDGIAISYDDFSGQSMIIEAIAAAGSPQMTLNSSQACIEVMTGAMLPVGCDTVIRYEDVQINDDKALIQVSDVTKGQNVHRKGSDRGKGEVLIKLNEKLHSGHINILATVGLETVEVIKLPSIAIISTGDELVDVSDTPLPHQIRRSNSHMLAALISNHYLIQPNLYHINDNEDQIEKELSKVLDKYDVVILSGGVSMGKYDFVPTSLEKQGVECVFHKIAQRPGKPFWFGVKDVGPVVFGLPGNPASSLACTTRYIIPWIETCLTGIWPCPQKAILQEDVTFSKDLTYFAQVALQMDNGCIQAFPVFGNGSGDLANLGVANAFLELPAHRSHFQKGENFPVFRYN